MRALLWIGLIGIASLAACASADSKLKEVKYGRPIEGEFDDILDRAEYVLRKHFPKGLDPDRTDVYAGDLWTIWHYKKSVMYRGTVRHRAHVVLSQEAAGRVRIGISVVQQTNDNIVNPYLVDEARWVSTKSDADLASLIERQIARRYLTVEPSESWKEKHREKPRGVLRPDIVDRNRDVDLEGEDKPQDSTGLPSVTGREDFWDPRASKKKKKEEENR